MIWQNPLAFAGLLLLVVPILIHLLGRRTARVEPFPTLRFLESAVFFVRRRSRLSDLLLLAVRLLIVAAAVAALAQPLWLTQARERTLARRLARVIVLDTSASMRPALSAARPEAQRLAQEAQTVVLLETADPATEMRGAAQWLSTHAGRSEIVLLSDFQKGGLTERSLRDVPDVMGIRLIRFSGRPVTPAIQTGASGAPLLLAPDADRARAQATLEAARALAPETSHYADSIAIVFAGYAVERSSPPDRAWMAGIIQAVDRRSLVDVATTEIDGRQRLLLYTSAAAGTLDAAEFTLAVLRAAAPRIDLRDLEPDLIPDSTLRRWQRAPARASVTQVGASDGRWLWLLVLLLIGAETVMRRGRRVA